MWPEHCCRSCQSLSASQPDYQEYQEIHADVRIVDDRLHGIAVGRTGSRLKRRMRMPLPEVIEARKIIARTRKERLQLSGMAGRVAYEMDLRSSRPLNRNIDDSEHIVTDVLTHQQPADLPSLGSAEFLP